MREPDGPVTPIGEVCAAYRWLVEQPDALAEFLAIHEMARDDLDVSVDFHIRGEGGAR